MAAHDELIRVAGQRAVAALFARAPERVERLFFVADMRQAMAGPCKLLAAKRKIFRVVDAEELRRVAGTAMHGGVVALARPRPVLPLDPAALAREAKAHPLLVILDGVGNPQNLGAIARTMAFFGRARLVLSDHPAQAGLSDAAYRVAEGGLDHIEVFRAADLAAQLKPLSAGYRIVGTALERGVPPAAVPRDQPIALILGNEEQGARGLVLASCAAIVTVPGSARVQSLNVSATAAILIHAFH